MWVARSRAEGVTMRLRMPGMIDADDRRILVDARSRPPRQRCEAVHIFAAVELECPRIIDAVEVTVGLERLADAIHLPALDLRVEILVEHLQPADQPVAGIDVGDLQHAIARANAGHVLFGGVGPDELGALLRQRPQFARVLEADALDQIGER
ncbi:hypothetical protein ACVW0J_004503 [Bradyrhizobium sp. i1.7.7]